MAKILVIDDEPANRLLIATVLRYAGHDVLEAENGDRGLESARHHRPDLIIVDLYLPGMHGTQFVKAVRGDSSIGATKIALYTGSNVDALLADFMRMHGITHVIPKPAEPDDLVRAIADALTG